MTPIHLELQHVTVRAAGRTLLDDICLNVTPGEHLAILGPNGAGKTTLLETIMGFVVPGTGQVQIDGRPWRGADRTRFGYVFQRYVLEPGTPFTVRDVIAMGAAARVGLFKRMDRTERERLQTIAGFVGLDTRLDQPVGTLSGGEQQKLAVARCLMQEASFLLLDEVTANLDFKSRRTVIDLLERVVHTYPRSLLFVTHWLESIPRSCRDVVCMRSGRIIHRGPRDELDDDRLEALYTNGE